MKVCKFGGSCLTSHEKLLRIKDIVKQDKSRLIIVVSAIGKCFDSDIKLTDLLISLTECKNYKAKREKLVNGIQEKLMRFAHLTNCKAQIIDEFNTFKNNLQSYDQSFIISRGEYFTAKIIASYLGFEFCDAKNFICFDNGLLNFSKSFVKFNGLNFCGGIVIPGFYGLDSNGKIALFERGGGDLTASLVANFCRAELYENYTDVDGILTADPKIFNKCKRIDFLSYSQCYELSNSGAKVFYKNAVLPIFRGLIPTKIINLESNNSTLISPNENLKFFNISVEKGFVLLSFNNSQKISKSRFISNILNIIMSRKIKVYDIKWQGNELFVVITKQEDNKLEMIKNSLEFVSKNICKVTINGKSEFNETVKTLPYLFFKRCNKKGQIRLYLNTLNLINLQIKDAKKS